MKLHFDAVRSYLMCPGLNEPMLIKAAGRGADVAVIDLEDSVPLAAKQEARTIAARVTSTVPGNFVVRINDMVAAQDIASADILAILNPELKGIVVPKVESPDALTRIYAMLEQNKNKLCDGFEVIPLIETPAGVEFLDRILTAKSPWFARVGFGAGDYTASLGVEWSHRAGQLLYPRSRIASLCNAYGMSAPIDTGSPLLDDSETFIADGMEAKLLGFKSKFCIHPRQADWVHKLFEPTAAEIAHATKVVEAYERVVALGKGELVASAEGLMIDPPVVKHSYSILQRLGRR